MIRGYFDRVSYQQPVPRLEVVVFLPDISPRWAPVTFLIDTGATHSVLQAADVLKGFRIDEAHLESSDRWSRRVEVSGVGGRAIHYIERALYVFTREDSTTRIIDQEIQIAQLVTENQTLPSLLGWDVLRHFRVCLDVDADEVTLEER